MTIKSQSISTAYLHPVRIAQAIIASCLLTITVTTITPVAASPQQPSKPDAPQSRLGQLAAREMRKEQSQVQNREEIKPAGSSSNKVSRRYASRDNSFNKWAGTRKGRSRRRPNSRRPASVIQSDDQTATELDVTFVAEIPKVEIKLNGNQEGTRFLGATGDDGKLIAKIKPGLYVATLSHPGYFILNRQVEVRSDLITHFFKLEAPEMLPITPAVILTPTLTPEPAITPQPVNNIKTLTAESILERYLDPKQTDTLAADDWEKVLSLTNDALGQDADNQALKARSFFAQGQLAYLSDKYSDALLAFTDAAQALPKSALPSLGRGNTYLALKQYGEAIKEYEQANKIYSLEANRDLAIVHRGIADALSAQWKPEEAIKHYNQAKFFGYSSSEMLTNMARALMKQKRWRLALNELVAAAKLKQTVEMMMMMGDCHKHLKQTQDASQSYRTATELDNKSAPAFFKLGGELLKQGKYFEAKQALDRAVALDPTSIKIDLARARRMAGDAEKKMARP